MFILGGDSCKCLYVPDEQQPVCIFGQALLKFGFPKEDLQKYDNGKYGQSIKNVLQPLNFHKNVVNWAVNLQTMQDDGVPWQECLDTLNEPLPITT